MSIFSNLFGNSTDDEEGEELNLPLLDEHGYELLTDGEGNEILDDWGEPIRLGISYNTALD